MNLNKISEHPYGMATVMALTVAVLFNICFLLFFAYGDYIISSNQHEKRMMPPHERMEVPSKEMPPKEIPPRMEHEEKPGFPPRMFFENVLRHFLSTLILFAFCMHVLFRSEWKEWKKITFIAIISIAWILLYGFLSARFMDFGDHGGPGGKIHFVRAMTTIGLFLGLTVFFLSLLIYYISRCHETAMENEVLRTLNYSNQYEALKSKLDPHFLFNALNTLSGLIAIKSDRTEEYIQKLSSIFRTTLSHEDVTTLADEIDFAKAYGDLMTIRYEKSLCIAYKVPDEMMNRKIVSFGIQTLLENAIKHNTITMRMPMAIDVIYEEGHIVVRNQIHPRKETEQSNGLGLKLLSERCNALLGKDIIIEDNDAVFTVKIPLG